MKVVSTALFAHKDGNQAPNFYSSHLPLFIRASLALYEDWTIRIHHDGLARTCNYGRALEALHSENLIELQEVGPTPVDLMDAMLWRILPLWDPLVSHFVSRDSDSAPSPRERVMVEEWEASGKALHTIHDHHQHSGMMGGLSSYRADLFREYTKHSQVTFEEILLAGKIHVDKHGYSYGRHARYADQDTLNVIITPMMGRPLIHSVKWEIEDEFSRKVADGTAYPKSFPVEAAEYLNSLAGTAGSCINPAAAVAAYDHHANHSRFSANVTARLQRVLEIEKSVGWENTLS